MQTQTKTKSKQVDFLTRLANREMHKQDILEAITNSSNAGKSWWFLVGYLKGMFNIPEDEFNTAINREE